MASLKCVDTFRRMWGRNFEVPPIMFGARTSLTVNIFSPNFQGVSTIRIYIDFRDIFELWSFWAIWDDFSQAHRLQTLWDRLKGDFRLVAIYDFCIALEMDFSDVWNFFLEQYIPILRPSNGLLGPKMPQSLHAWMCPRTLSLCSERTDTVLRRFSPFRGDWQSDFWHCKSVSMGI